MGSGKSSLLEALLGEILPLQKGAGGNAADAGPRLRGRVAFCSQVPWIVSGSVRVTVTLIFLYSSPSLISTVVLLNLPLSPAPCKHQKWNQGVLQQP